jgi:hypothetical protein
MNLNNLTAKQKTAYDRLTKQIRKDVGSYHTIALRIYMNCNREVTGETVRNWFFSRTIPVEMAFVLYEICDKTFDPLVFYPWLAEHVALTNGAAAARED